MTSVFNTYIFFDIYIYIYIKISIPISIDVCYLNYILDCISKIIL